MTWREEIKDEEAIKILVFDEVIEILTPIVRESWDFRRMQPWEQKRALMAWMAEIMEDLAARAREVLETKRER